MKGDKVVLGITQGDINGIGYEVIIKSLLDNRIYDQMIPVIYGSPKVAAYHRKALNIENFSFNTVRTADEAVARRANIINCIDDATRVELGKSTPQAGEASYLALEAACADIEAGKIDALVTGPINKMNIQSDKFHFSGHTEYLKARFRSEHALMLMINDLMRVGVVTTHLPLSDVPSKVTQEAILEKLRILNDTLRIDFILSAPRIAVLSLNPHAGDEGLIGREEIEVINPALEQAKEEDILAFGPFPSDGFLEQEHTVILMQFWQCIMTRV
jgi:4-hydroxythreonine-4-phosphate dehydrogenase